MLETIPEVPEIEIENGVVISGESDVSQSTLAVSEDSTINSLILPFMKTVLSLSMKASLLK